MSTVERESERARERERERERQSELERERERERVPGGKRWPFQKAGKSQINLRPSDDITPVWLRKCQRG